MKLFYEIIITKPLQPLTYSSDKRIAVGQIVRVPVNNEEVFGIVSKQSFHYDRFVTSSHNQSTKPKIHIKEVAKILPQKYPKEFIKFIIENSKKYKITEGKMLSFARSILIGLEKYGTSTEFIRFSLLKRKFEINLLSNFFNLKENTWRGKNNLFIFPSKVALLDFTEILDRKNIEYQTFLKNSDLKNLNLEKASNILILRKGIFLPHQIIDNIFIINYHQKYKFFEKGHPEFSYQDLAINLGKVFNSKVFLISETPFSKDFKELNKVTELISVKPKSFSEIIVFQPRKRNFWISPIVQESILNGLNLNKNCLILWERKGFAGWGECGTCGEKLVCSTCKNLAEIRNGLAICKSCNLKTEALDFCRKCKNSNLIFHSKGVDLLQNEIAAELNISKTKIFILNAGIKLNEVAEIKKQLEAGGKILLSTTAIIDSIKLRKVRFDTLVILRIEMFFYLEDNLSKERFIQKISDLDDFAAKVSKVSYFQTEKESEILKQGLRKNV